MPPPGHARTTAQMQGHTHTQMDRQPENIMPMVPPAEWTDA